MKPYFWIVFLIVSSIFTFFSTENEKFSLFSSTKQHTLQDDVLLEKKSTIHFSETPICPTNFNIRTINKTNLLKKWSRHGNALASYGDKNIKQKQLFNLGKSFLGSLSSHYDSRFYVYYLRKLLL